MKNIVAEEEKAASERTKKERKQTLTNRILEIKHLLQENTNNLEATKKKLEDTSGFKFFRSASEKKEQISLLEKNIIDYNSENDKLEKESDILKLELEKIK